MHRYPPSFERLLKRAFSVVLAGENVSPFEQPENHFSETNISLKKLRRLRKVEA